MPGSADLVQRFVHVLEAVWVKRAVAAGQLQAHGKNLGQKIWVDTSNAPLPPLIDAIALQGEYRDWSTVILRSLDLQKFPLKWATLLGLENECVFFSDHDRQQINTGK